jgi:hypothetical protein
MRRSDRVAVLAELKRDCTALEPSEAVAVTDWGLALAESNVLVLVNSLSADRVVLGENPCEQIQDAGIVAYDYRCSVFLDPGSHSLQLVRSYFDDRKSLVLLVAIP